MPYNQRNYGYLDYQQPIIGGQPTNLYNVNLSQERVAPGEVITSSWHTPFSQSQRRYLGSAGALREAIGAAYGINPSGRIGKYDERNPKTSEAGYTEPLDPTVRLENILYDQYKNYRDEMKGEQQSALLRNLFNTRNSTMNALMRQRSAAFGTPGLYQGAMSANEAVRDTMVNQAVAAYKPMESALRDQYEQQNQELLNTLQQIQTETESTVRSIGRGAKF